MLPATAERSTRDALARFIPEPTDATRRLLDEVRLDLEAMEPMLRRRDEASDLFVGEHWNRSMPDPDRPGTTVKEETYIQRQGLVPWKMNHVSPVVRQLLGQYLQNKSERMAFATSREANDAAEMMTVALRYVRRDNDAKEHEVDQLLELLIGGFYAWKTGAETDEATGDARVLVEPVDVERFFYTRTARGRRLRGLTRIGEVHDVELEDLVGQLATGERGPAKAHADALREHFKAAAAGERLPYERGDLRRQIYAPGTLDSPLSGLCRVVEVWTLERRPVTTALDPLTGTRERLDWTDAEIVVEQQARAAAGAPALELTYGQERAWVRRLLTPEGHVLAEADSPYVHGEHPYTVGFGMLWRDRAWGLVHDIEDPQRLVNRLVIAIDGLISASSKGLLLIPEESVPEGMSIEDFAAEWTRMNGVIAYKAKPGVPLPQQITALAVPAEVFNWLGAHKTWIDELSGVNGAMLGKAPQSGTPAAMYGMQQQQAALTTAVFFDAFFRTLQRLDKKLIKVIAQFYEEPRALRDEASQGFVRFDPEAIRGLDFDVVVGDSMDTATYRQLFEGDMQTWLAAGHLTFRQYLEASSHPRSNQILRLIERTNPLLLQQPAQDVVQGAQQAMAAAAPPSPEATAQALMLSAQSGDQEAATLLRQAADAGALPASPAPLP